MRFWRKLEPKVQKASRMCKVSVIIPMYNSQEFIEPCLESVLGQTFQDLEVLLIDDGSTDNSLVKVEKFQNDQRLRVLLQQDNVGVAVARNLGISNARGRYIAFCDSDDTWHPDKL